MKIVIIPARYQSSRFPGKPLAEICGKPMIQHVYERASKTQDIDGIYVATDDKRIFDCVESFGGNVLMTSAAHTCGSERLAECVEILQLGVEDIVLNIQGDEPLISQEMIRDLISTFDDPDVYMGSLRKAITASNEVDNPNVVKVITDINNDAIYFSRFSLPYDRNGIKPMHYKHIGVYGYKVWFLKKYSQMPNSSLELSESLEQLRVLENGFKIRVKETSYQTVGVDTPEQLEAVKLLMRMENNDE